MAAINTFTQWATEMINLLEDGKLDQGRWFARVNSVLVGLGQFAYCTDYKPIFSGSSKPKNMENATW